MKPVLCKVCGKPLKPHQKLDRKCADCELAE